MENKVVGLMLALMLTLLLVSPVSAQIEVPVVGDTNILVSLVTAVVSFSFGYILKRGAPAMIALIKLMNKYEELGAIAVAIVTLVERKYAECDGHQQFEAACAQMSVWSKGALTPEEIEELVQTAYSVAKGLFLKQWSQLKPVSAVGASTKGDCALS
jgi:alkylhydroperoxidase/carboxymuconolactone decarboxylase family protein YurZ